MPNASIFAESGRIVMKVAICLATIACAHAYTSSQFVKVAHSIPHLTKLLQLQSSDFGLTSASTGGDKYFLSLMTLPVLLMVIGIFGLSTFGVILISRICWSCAVNSPYRKEVKEESDEEYSGWSQRIIKCRRFLLSSFIVFFMLAFTSTQVGWYGYTRFDVGISGISKSYDSLLGTFSSLQTQGQSLLFYFSHLFSPLLELFIVYNKLCIIAEESF